MNSVDFPQGFPTNRRPGDVTVAEQRVQPAASPMFVKLLNIIRRRKWVMLGALVVAAIAGLVATLLMTPKFTAEVQLEVQRENNRIVNVEGVEPESTAADLEFYETQWGLLRSRTLAERVVTELRLHERPEFFESFGAKEQVEQLQGSPTASGRRERIQDAADILLRNVVVSPQRLSRLVDVRVTTPDPELSTRIANKWADAFIKISLERRFDATSYARQFLETRLAELRQKLQESERALVGYAENERIINVPTSTTTGELASNTERPLVAEDLSALNAELNQARAARIEAQSRLRAAGGATTEALQNQAISDLRTRRASLTAERAKLLAQFTPNYPPVQAIDDQIAELDRSLAREEGRIVATLNQNYAATSARENLLTERVRALEGDLLRLRDRTIQYNIFQREVDTNRQLYDALLQRYKEIGVSAGVGVNNISVVDPAQIPERPSSPNLIINLLISLVVGSVIGAGLALALEQIDETISDPREVEEKLGLPLLGTIPVATNDEPIEDLSDRKSPIVESYLSSLTRLSFATDHGVPKVLAITSTRPGEGKSTTALAFAQQLARGAKRVVLIDGDMRSPSLHGIVNLKNDRGLSNYLAGDDDLSSMLHQSEGAPTYLLAGPQPPNAAELLSGDRLRHLFETLLRDYSHVIVDAPPVMGLADTPIIGSVAEGVVFVLESHGTSAAMARVAVDRLRSANGKLLGALLTKFQMQKADYGYGYEYGYGYGEAGEARGGGA